jgi:hypothetical protein
VDEAQTVCAASCSHSPRCSELEVLVGDQILAVREPQRVVQLPAVSRTVSASATTQAAADVV